MPASMTSGSAFARLATGAKLLLVLSLVMLPIGGALVWSAQPKPADRQ